MARTDRAMPTIVVHQRRDGKVAGNGDQKEQRGKEREEEVVGELRCHAEAVVLEDGVNERSSENLGPGKRDSKTS